MNTIRRWPLAGLTLAAALAAVLIPGAAPAQMALPIPGSGAPAPSGGGGGGGGLPAPGAPARPAGPPGFPMPALGEATLPQSMRRPPPDPFALPLLSKVDLEPLRINGMQPVGNYAYTVSFSDGHDTGIYTFELLRELGTEIQP